MTIYDTIEEAISNGSEFYLDQDALAQGRSGGVQCPVCRKFDQPWRKLKNPQPTWINDCSSCEIKDPFRRMWHEINLRMDDENRIIFNSWLSQLKKVIEDVQYGCFDRSCLYCELIKITSIVPFMSSGVEE